LESNQTRLFAFRHKVKVSSAEIILAQFVLLGIFVACSRF